jgi:hypothetical protein
MLPQTGNIGYYMRPFALVLFLVNLTVPAVLPAPAADDLSEPMGFSEAPKALCRVWLRFHETDLCQGMDAVFVFSRNGMEAWIRVRDKKSYEKLQRLLEPLQDIHRIALYATHPKEDKESGHDWDPPSSLWENYELRSSLGDPFARARERLGFNTQRDMILPPADEMLKQRLLVYAEEVLERNWKIKRYASDLPSLARVATDPALDPEFRQKAAQISKAHARDLQKELEKLEKSLKYAFPRSREEKNSSPNRKQSEATRSFTDLAQQIAVEVQSAANHVDNFIYPRQYTVDLGELRQPSLLEEIKRLGKMVSDFQKAPANPASAF